MEFDELFNLFDNDTKIITSDKYDSIKYLYEIVHDYIQNNYLYTDLDDVYYIKYKNNIYFIACSFIYDYFYYLKKTDIENINNCFDYDDIINNNITDKQLEKKEIFDRINDSIKILHDEGVSNYTIKKALKL